MLIINADDWGRSRAETDAANQCFAHRAITSVSAMVFMEDSERAADIAKATGVDVGLHVNLTQPFATGVKSSLLHEHQKRVARFLTSNKYAQLIYHPILRQSFRYTYQAQYDEFVRLYGNAPSHIDGHQHMHLCANMLVDRIIPVGAKVRRNFSFKPGEKGWLNRRYRRASDKWLSRRYRLTDYFFALSQSLTRAAWEQIGFLAATSNVEIMTHPVDKAEYALLMSNDFLGVIGSVTAGTYRTL